MDYQEKEKLNLLMSFLRHKDLLKYQKEVRLNLLILTFLSVIKTIP